MNANTRSAIEPIRALLPQIAARAAEFETERRMPLDLVHQLRASGAFRLAVPRVVAGAELSNLDLMDVLEDVGAVDASAAWTIAIAADMAILLTRLSLPNMQALYARWPELVCAGSLSPTGVAEVEEGSLLVEGQWPFASGCLHADAFLANCVLRSNGEPVPGPTAGRPRTRVAVVPREEIQIVDTWHVAGLKGTGSHDVSIPSSRVPTALSLSIVDEPCLPGELYRVFAGVTSLRFAALALGIARGALGDVRALAAEGAGRRLATRSFAATPLVQQRIGECELEYAMLHAGLRAQMKAYQAGADRVPSGPQTFVDPLVNACTATGAFVARRAAHIVTQTYELVGGRALYESSPLQRRLRDVHALTQHAAVSEGSIGVFGAILLGAAPSL